MQDMTRLRTEPCENTLTKVEILSTRSFAWTVTSERFSIRGLFNGCAIFTNWRSRTWSIREHPTYSFELSDHLSRMRVSGLLKLQPQPYPYGPSLGFGDGAGTLKEMYPKTVDRYSELVNFVSDVVAGKGVSQLEKLATALYVTDELGENKSVGERAKRLVEHKPHIDMQAANDAVSEIDGVMRLKRARFS